MKFGNSAHGGLRILARAAKLRQLKDNPDNVERTFHYRGWLDGNFIFSLSNATAELKEAGAFRNDDHVRLGWQARTARGLRTSRIVPPWAHVRRRLDHWRVDVLPGHRVDRWVKVMDGTASLLPPRVRACQIRTIFNGWMTCRRFQRVGGCI